LGAKRQGHRLLLSCSQRSTISHLCKPLRKMAVSMRAAQTAKAVRANRAARCAPMSSIFGPRSIGTVDELANASAGRFVPTWSARRRRSSSARPPLPSWLPPPSLLGWVDFHDRGARAMATRLFIYRSIIRRCLLKDLASSLAYPKLIVHGFTHRLTLYPPRRLPNGSACSRPMP
jgi:hypothetical protein